MEMAANIWSSSAGGGGDWRSVALARAPQIVTFVLALALAAQLALIVVSLSGRGRQTAMNGASQLATRRFRTGVDRNVESAAVDALHFRRAAP